MYTDLNMSKSCCRLFSYNTDNTDVEGYTLVLPIVNYFLQTKVNKQLKQHIFLQPHLLYHYHKGLHHSENILTLLFGGVS